jgi:hypothetical protein
VLILEVGSICEEGSTTEVLNPPGTTTRSAAWEEPQLFSEEIRSCFRPLRPMTAHGNRIGEKGR